MNHRYPIPAKTVRTEITIHRSRFIATVGYAETVEAARAFIRQIRDEMPDANHHVYAFRVGYGSSVQEGLSDDGEPAGTSGKPIMSILRGTDVGDIVVVVTRYFGGIKLGTGGLVRAYGGAAKEALALLPIKEKVRTVAQTMTLPYHAYEPCKRILSEYEAQIIEERFESEITLQFLVPEDMFEALSNRIRELTRQ